MLSFLNEKYIDRKILLNIIINKNLDVEKFNEKYKIKVIEYIGAKQNYIDFNAAFFDKLDDKDLVKAVSYLGGKERLHRKSVYILLDRNDDIKLEEILDKDELADYRLLDFTIDERDKEFTPGKIDIVFNLLLNMLAKYPEDGRGFSNTKGQLYLYVPTNAAKKNQIITMSVRVKNGLLLRDQVSFRPFDSNSSKDKKKAKYALVDGPVNTILLKRYEGEGVPYVRGGIQSNRVIIDVDTFFLHDKKMTKVRLCDDLVGYFNYKYKGLCQLEFKVFDVKTKFIEGNTKLKEKKKESIEELETIYFVRLEKPEGKKEEEKVKKYIEKLEKIHGDIKEVNELVEDALNIVLIHDENYYKENEKEDIKLSIPTDIVSQCVTLEGLGGTGEAPAKHVFNELYVKNELHRGVIPRWQYGEMEFYVGLLKKIDVVNEEGEKKEEDKEWHCLMHMYEDGTFDITLDPEKIDLYKYRKYLSKKDKCICIVSKGDKCNMIEHTDYLPIVDYDKIKELEQRSIEKGNATTRVKDESAKKDGFTHPYFGKSVMVIDDELHYCVGESDLQYFQKKMCNIYRLKVLDDSDYIYEILDMLEDPHVRSNLSESVRPYPFKYMMEYIRLYNPGVYFYLK